MGKKNEMGKSLILVLTVCIIACKTPETKIALDGAFTIQNQLIDSQYPIVGSLHLKGGKYQFVPDHNYKGDNFKKEFYSQNPSGTYDINYNTSDSSNLENNHILGTVHFISPNKKKHSALLRLDLEKQEVYFHSIESRFERFSISRPIK